MATITEMVGEVIDRYNKLQGDVNELVRLVTTVVQNEKVATESITNIYRHLGINIRSSD